ncbi:MAG: hypothetical protein WA177_06885 [Xanthobacteraceae bacterium]
MMEKSPAIMRPGEDTQQRHYVQVAEIEIDPSQSGNYRTAVREQIEAAIRAEP